MSALAIAFHKKGWKVTGSDAGFYPPISTKLKNEGIEFYPGWHPESMGSPDLVVVGNVASSNNPEWKYVQEKKLEYKSYPDVVAEYFVNKNSIVCAGTYGKTTSTVLLAWILKESGFDPSYMFGGLSLNDIDAANISDSDWSILEGDEYKSSRWDNQAKFIHYSPTHLLLTSVVWDHADIYPTEQSYVDAFQKLFNSVPNTGLIIISEKAIEVIDTDNKKFISYGQDTTNDYQYKNIIQSKSGIDFDIIHKNKTYQITNPALGEYMADNMTGCFALAREIGISTEEIIKSIKSFKSVKRRLEKRFEVNITVFDDIAHSPSKAEAILNTLKTVYDGKIIAVYEPNTGNRRPASIPGYEETFTSADEVIIPKLTKLKIDPNDEEKPMTGPKLAGVISKTHPNARCVEKDDELINYLVNNSGTNDVIVFLGSHGFRGMIETLVERLKDPRENLRK
jgi:UDP-N-acetylmuramate: L-alanyl-gamma-D-glutamyl-meso-diaminopimelate ligase